MKYKVFTKEDQSHEIELNEQQIKLTERIRKLIL